MPQARLAHSSSGLQSWTNTHPDGPRANQLKFLSYSRLSFGELVPHNAVRTRVQAKGLSIGCLLPFSQDSGNQPNLSWQQAGGDIRGNDCGLCAPLTAKGQAGDTIAGILLVQSSVPCPSGRPYTVFLAVFLGNCRTDKVALHPMDKAPQR